MVEKRLSVVRVRPGATVAAALLTIAMAALLLLSSVSPASAATFDVTRTGDPVPDGCTADDCSLREAVIAANEAEGADTVNLPAGTYELAVEGRGEDEAATGDLDITDELTITGAGARSTVVDANSTDRVFQILGTTEISGITITGGVADGNGGGAKISEDLTLDRVTVDGNSAETDGGGLETDDFPTVIVSRSAITNNTADDDAGGFEIDSGVIEIVNSTMSGNTADAEDGGGGDGGAIDNDTGTIDEDTGEEDSITISDSTITDNTTADEGGAISRGINVEVRNSIIAENTDGTEGTDTDNCAGDSSIYTSLGNNLENLDTCNFAQVTDQPDTEPNIGPLANNGGQTNTHALRFGSPAIDAGDSDETTDQRNQTRPQDYPGVASAAGGDGSDTGAFEVQPSTFTVSDPTVAESGGDVTFTVTRTGGDAAFTGASVSYDTADGTATAGEDYEETSGSLTFAAGDTEETVSVNITDDEADEPDETFTLELSDGVQATTGDSGTATITDDDEPEISINDVTVGEGDSGETTNAVFTVTLDQPSSQTVTVDYTTVDGTAKQPSDYRMRSGIVTFEPGDTAEEISVPVVGDAVAEANETFSVRLSNPENAAISDGQGTATIRDNDGCTINGTARNDLLRGTPGRDVICGLGGNDFIRAAGGNDILRGGNGNDDLRGEAGNDELYGESGNDSLYGGPGTDRLNGGPGRNSLNQ